MYFEVLLEGTSDMPTVREIMTRGLGLREGADFRLHPHRGRGVLPANPEARPNPKHRGLLDRLPSKLRGYSHLSDDYCVVVLIDSDTDDCRALLSQLNLMLDALSQRPKHVLFRIAIEEIESWFIADAQALVKAYPRAKIKGLPGPPPDRVIGAWEALAHALGQKPARCTGADKAEWATKIAPHLNLITPLSPSLRAFIRGIRRFL